VEKVIYVNNADIFKAKDLPRETLIKTVFKSNFYVVSLAILTCILFEFELFITVE